MNSTIQVPASSIQKATEYGANVIITSTGVSFYDGTTVTSTLGAVITTTDPAYTQANIATNLAQSAYGFANTLAGGSSTDNVARVSAQAAFNKANTVGNYLTANTLYISDVNTYQNSRIDGAYTQANNATNFFKGTTGSASPTSGSITLNSTTGLTFSGSGNTITINTPQSVSTTSDVTFNSLTLTNALPITQGGTGGTSASAALTNLLPTGTTSGYVLTTGGPGTFYWAAGGGGGGSGATPGTTISSTRISYTASGSTSAYTTPTYVPGASQLRVYFDGLRQFASEYTETNSTTVTFNTAPTAGVVILIEVDGYINNPYYANTIAFTAPFGGIVSTANTIQLAIQDVETRKATLVSPTFTGTPAAPTPAANTSTTQIATTAFVTSMISANVNSAIQNALPTGVIVMWSGSIASIPAGWYLCNGVNGTPDLRDRFVVGAGSTYAVSATGGSKDAVVVTHSHTASSSSSITDPGHNHQTALLAGNSAGVSWGSGGSVLGISGSSYGSGAGAYTSSSGTGISVSTSTTITSTGVSGTNANLPPYYALAYIMKA